MGYTDNYERDVYGILAFWLRNDYDHGRFFDREISHHELELARANQHMIIYELYGETNSLFKGVSRQIRIKGGILIVSSLYHTIYPIYQTPFSN